MIKIENVEVMGWEHAIRGMRNAMNNWDKSDSGICKGGDSGIGCENCANYESCEHTYDYSWQLGKEDYALMMQFADDHPMGARYRRMITVNLDITAPLYWWKDFYTYEVGVVVDTRSALSELAAKEFTLDDFSCEHLVDEDDNCWLCNFDVIIDSLNSAREMFLMTKDKKYWWQMIQLLPASYHNQKRTVMTNYETLTGVYPTIKIHELDEWREFCNWIETLPYSEIITGKKMKIRGSGYDL